MEATTADIDLDAAPASAGAARRFIRDTLTEWSCAAAVDAVTFLANELVTNAILHAGGPVILRLRSNRVRIRCEVHDSCEEGPSVRSYAVDDLTGRGLALVVAMAAAWGVDRTRGGKCVWFEIEK